MNKRIWSIVISAGFFLAVLICIGRLNNLKAADWASWVQAFGSIAAIIGAYLIADFQHRRQVEAERANKVEDEIRRLEITKAFLSEVALAAYIVNTEVRGPHVGATSDETVAYLVTQINALQQLPIMEIPDAQLVSKIVGLIKVAREFEEFMQPFIGNHVLPGLEDDRRGRITREVRRLSLVSDQANDRCDLALGLRR